MAIGAGTPGLPPTASSSSGTLTGRHSRVGLKHGFSWSMHTAREEHEHLIATAHDDEEHADSDGLYPPHCCWTSDNPDPPNPHRGLPIYQTIHR